MKKPLKKQLEEALAQAEYQKQEANKYYSRASKAEEELKKINEEKIYTLQNDISAEQRHSKALFEIIRWMINPTNSKDPWNEIERQSKNVPPKYF